MDAFTRSGIRHVVETGTPTGVGVSIALPAGYDKITSIEEVSEIHRTCSKTFEKEISQGRVDLLLGDPGEVIDRISMSGPILYWIDMHHREGNLGIQIDNCPLGRELHAIVRKANYDDVVVINGVRTLEYSSARSDDNSGVESGVGKLLDAFPNHVAFCMDGQIPRDVLVFVPARLARSFFFGLPGVHPVTMQKNATEAVSARPSARKLAVFAGGNNSRIGNILPLYGRLHSLARVLGRTLSFPFAERAISNVFERMDGISFLAQSMSVHLNAGLSRLIRTGEEVLEKAEGAEPFRYSPNVMHHVDFPEIGIRTIFSRGGINISDVISLAVFDTDLTVVWRDPFPLAEVGGTNAAVFSYLASFLRVREDVRTTTAARRLAQFGGTFKRRDRPCDVCFHVRQGDFRRWEDGKFFYEEDLVAAIIEALQARFDRAGREICITLLSDEPLSQSLLQPGRVEWFSSDFAGDFVRIATSDFVVSNRSTFSETATAVGSAFLRASSRYHSLGPARSALAALERLNFDSL